MRITDYLQKYARRYPDRIFIRFQGQAITYREGADRVNRLASALREQFGISKGDRVAILSRNHPAFLVSYLACGMIGAVVVPINYRLQPEEYAYFLNHSESRLLIVEGEFLEAYRSIRPNLETVEKILIIGASDEGLEYESVIRSASPKEVKSEVTENESFVQMYTSGTTGVPKGVLLSHRNIVATAFGLDIEGKINLDHCDILVVAPMFHIAALDTICGALILGGSCNLKREFHPQEVIKGMSEEGSTHCFVVPLMIWALLLVPDVEQRDYSRLRAILYGGAPMSEPLLQRAREVFKCDFIQAYGLTETTGALGVLDPEDHQICPTATCREFIMAELRVVDPQGKPVKPGEVGEIVARGDGVMQGYWKMDEEIKDAFFDGWLRTGDLAIADDRGYITIVDRLKDMIIKGGQNIYPSEIERVLLDHPAVQQAAVIGVPDEKRGEEVKALLVLKSDHPATERELLQFCRDRLAAFKRPRSIEFRMQLPVSPTGKVLKKVLREEYWKGYDKRVH